MTFKVGEYALWRGNRVRLDYSVGFGGNPIWWAFITNADKAMIAEHTELTPVEQWVDLEPGEYNLKGASIGDIGVVPVNMKENPNSWTIQKKVTRPLDKSLE